MTEYNLSEAMCRTGQLIGEDNLEKLFGAHVAVFGLGGVGGYIVEALARSGVGHLTLVDHDRIGLSNLNRQIIATLPDIGRLKTDVTAERIKSIAPEIEVEKLPLFFLPENAKAFDFSKFDYIVDAVDTVSAKIALIECAAQANIPIISAMGAGNKLDPTAFEVADLCKTSVCPLAKVMRREMKQRGITHVKTVYSKEMPIKNAGDSPGSVAFVPSAAGLIIAGEVIKDLIGLGKRIIPH